MEKTTLGKLFLKELEMEIKSTRKCLERMDPALKEYRPHEKSMKMGSLAHVVAEIPQWIAHIITEGDIDFATWKSFTWNTAEELVQNFDRCVENAKAALESVSDEEMGKDFSLKNSGMVLTTDNKWNSISSTLNHLVHHRGQLTVYMRLNGIAVPSIYGPSGDDQSF